MLDTKKSSKSEAEKSSKSEAEKSSKSEAENLIFKRQGGDGGHQHGGGVERGHLWASLGPDCCDP